jgi:transposase-like protein
MAGITPIFDEDRKARFLDLLAAGTTTIADAARAVGVSPETPSRHRRTDADFAAAWDAAVEARADLLETEARRRALAKSDTLLVRLLEAEMPEKYATRSKIENRHGLVGAEPLDDTTLISRLAAILNTDISDLA